MIPGIIVLFYRSPLSMVARERISNENNVHFTFFAIWRANKSIKKILLKVLKKVFLSFKKCCIIVFTNFAKQILSKILKDKNIICKSYHYLALIADYVAIPDKFINIYTRTFLQTESSCLYIIISFDTLKRNKQG